MLGQDLVRGSSNPGGLLSGDFNFPRITWLDEGVINYCPTHGYDIDQLFLDAVNKYGILAINFFGYNNYTVY